MGVCLYDTIIIFPFPTHNLNTNWFSFSSILGLVEDKKYLQKQTNSIVLNHIAIDTQVALSIEIRYNVSRRQGRLDYQ